MGYCPKLCCDQGARQLGAGTRGTARALGAGPQHNTGAQAGAGGHGFKLAGR